ncbi:MAG: hypothetical protein ACKOSQ_07830 [Planctomycetaceae bacterium]
MNRTLWFRGPLAAGFAPHATALALVALVSTALAQPPEPPPGRPEGGPPPEHRDPLRAALDQNHDLELDADEIANAPDAIRKLDRNGDGRLDREEMRPPMGPPPGGPGRGPEGRGPEGRGPGDRGFEGGPPRRPGDSGGRPPRDGERPEGPPRPREGGRPEPGGSGDRPSPERFLERAKSFDADGDGKLDEGELKKWAETMAERMRGRGPGGSGGPPRDGGERPERPRRPE